MIWVSESDFRKAAYAQNAIMKVGDYSFDLSSEGRNSWQIMLDRERLLEIMDKEQQREYGLYTHEKKDKKEITVQEKRMSSEAEESTWKLVKDSNSVEDLRYFLEKFPDSPYAIPAKLKLKTVGKGEKNKRLNNFNLLSPAKTAYLVLQLAPCIALFFQTTCSGSLQ